MLLAVLVVSAVPAQASVEQGSELYRVLQGTRTLEGFRESIFKNIRRRQMLHKGVTLDTVGKYAVETENAVVRQKQTEFQKIDLDRDLVIDWQELHSFLIKDNPTAQKSKNQYTAVLSRAERYWALDTNEDYIITYEEFTRYDSDEIRKKSRFGVVFSVLLKELIALDPNGDGFLSLIEIDDILTLEFRKWDGNDDGLLDEDEAPSYITELEFGTLSGVKKRPYQVRNCKFDFPIQDEELVVYAALGYSGEQTDYQFKNSLERVGRYQLFINEPTKPVALVLGSYESSIWDIKYTRQTDIKYLIVTGYYQQAVIGVDENTKIINTAGHGNYKCGLLDITSDPITRLENIKKANLIAQNAYGRKIQEVYLMTDENNSSAKIDSENVPEDRFIQSSIYKVENYISKTTPRVGLEGLEYALEHGFVRKAELDEVEDWNNKIEKKRFPQSTAEYVRSNENSFDERYYKRPYQTERLPNNAYVILVDGYEVPKDFVGFFLVPEGVRPPFKNLAQSSIYDMNSLECYKAKGRCPVHRKPVYNESMPLAQFIFLDDYVEAWEEKNSNQIDIYLNELGVNKYKEFKELYFRKSVVLSIGNGIQYKIQGGANIIGGNQVSLRFYKMENQIKDHMLNPEKQIYSKH